MLAFGTSDGDLGLIMIEDMLEKRNSDDTEITAIQPYTSIKAH